MIAAPLYWAGIPLCKWSARGNATEKCIVLGPVTTQPVIEYCSNTACYMMFEICFSSGFSFFCVSTGRGNAATQRSPAAHSESPCCLCGPRVELSKAPHFACTLPSYQVSGIREGIAMNHILAQLALRSCLKAFWGIVNAARGAPLRKALGDAGTRCEQRR